MTTLIITGDGVDINIQALEDRELSVSKDLKNPDVEFYIVDCPYEVTDLAAESFDSIWMVGKCGSVPEDKISQVFPEVSDPTQLIAEAIAEVSESSAGSDDDDGENDSS